METEEAVRYLKKMVADGQNPLEEIVAIAEGQSTFHRDRERPLALETSSLQVAQKTVQQVENQKVVPLGTM